MILISLFANFNIHLFWTRYPFSEIFLAKLLTTSSSGSGMNSFHFHKFSVKYKLHCWSLTQYTMWSILLIMSIHPHGKPQRSLKRNPSGHHIGPWTWVLVDLASLSFTSRLPLVAPIFGHFPPPWEVACSWCHGNLFKFWVDGRYPHLTRLSYEYCEVEGGTSRKRSHDGNLYF